MPLLRSYLQRWPGSLVLLALSILLLSLAYAPYEQFYVAWVGLVPWLLAIAPARSAWRAFGWGWLGGVLFFGVNLAWLWRATIPGTIGLIAYLSLFWGLAAAVVRGSELLDTSVRPDRQSGWRAIGAIFAIAAVWTACEWLRATLLTGLPWMLLGQTQSPFLAMCQVADLTGIFGVSLWVMAVNALVAIAILNRENLRTMGIVGAGVAVLLVAILTYGIFRLRQPFVEVPGPRVMVVQSNHAHRRGGEKTVTQEQQIEYHLTKTREALQDKPADLVVWSETVMPGLNPEARDEPGLAAAPFLKQVHDALRSLASTHRVWLVTGGYYVGGWEGTLGRRRATDIRNAVYLYHPGGVVDDRRYDKIHLVPFGEFLPFRESAPRIHRLLRVFAAYSVDYALSAAPPDALTVFEIGSASSMESFSGPVRFVTPICFEDIDAALLARMFRPGPDGQKRADLIINHTNGGWFLGNHQAQHFQAAIFRSIENRAPTARSSNTGISGFIDSNGRTRPQWRIPVRTDGTLTRQVMLDRRIAPYSRVGNVFSYACVIVTAAIVIRCAASRFRRHDTRPVA